MTCGENESSGDAQHQQEIPGRFGAPGAGRETNSDENKNVTAASSRPKDADSTASTSVSRSKAKDHFDRRTETCETRAKALNTALDQAKKARDHLHDVKVRLSPSNRADEESKEAAEALDEEAAQPPEVVYRKDVALVRTGYHNTEASGEESDEVGKAPDPQILDTATRPRIISAVPFVLITTVDLTFTDTGG
ncbi:hypothetical protein FRC05_009143 [Tulasnella sp. 425]|nr:hypothetical protein FRC05_009143 [Tulasnella sp. 425]